jgi:hypothetical protein
VSKIRVCTMCGQLGQMLTVSPSAFIDVMCGARLMTHNFPAGWLVNVWRCDNCQTPLIEIYPGGLSQGARRELLGISDDDAPLVIEEG